MTIERGKAPFSLVSSSANGGYVDIISSSFKAGVDIANIHQDIVGGLENEPAQGPFTEQHVGGNQHRHTPLNTGNDTPTDRAESFLIKFNSNNIRVYGPDAYSVPRASMLRGMGSKTVLNVENISSSLTIRGNYQDNYEVVMTSGRRINNKYFKNNQDNFEGFQATQFITGARGERTLPNMSGTNSVIVERFNAPGGAAVSPRGVLDQEAEEYAVNNDINYRNRVVRQPFNIDLYTHSEQFSTSSIHKTYRNPLRRAGDVKYDNWFIQHEIPVNDIQYAWISASATTTAEELGGHQISGAYSNRGGAYTDISFSTASLVLVGGVETEFDILGIGNEVRAQENISVNLTGGVSTNLYTRTFSTGTFGIYNGAYGYPTWKQIRTGEHPVARKLRQNNIVSVQQVGKEKRIERAAGSFSVKEKRGQQADNFIEPPVSIKYKPMEHYFIFKESSNPFAGQAVKHSYTNNISQFANSGLNKRLNTSTNIEQQYDRITNLYINPNIPEEENPVSRFIGMRYEETIWPKEQNTFLGRTRGRTLYILDEAGTGSNGYDVANGTHRVFWRDSFDDRKRTAGSGSSLSSSALNSQGNHLGQPLQIGTNDTYSEYWGGISQREVLPLGRSVMPLDTIIDSASLTHRREGGLGFPVGGPVGYYQALCYANRNYIFDGGGELNNNMLLASSWIQTDVAGLPHPITPGTKIFSITTPEFLYFYGEVSILIAVGVRHEINYKWNIKPRAKYIPDVAYGGRMIATQSFRAYEPFYPVWTGSQFDAGLTWRVEEESGKKPWYDSYDDYAVDIRAMGQGHSIIPEFNISEHMDYYINDAGGNFRKRNNSHLTIDGGLVGSSSAAQTSSFTERFFSTYVNGDKLLKNDLIKKEHKNKAKEKNISIRCSGIKKLMPYDGFYPQTRTLQLANLFSSSIGSFVKGGYIYDFEGNNINGFTTGSSTGSVEEETARWYAFLQPFFAPGIMYNTIKSGIAVDWPMYTASYIDGRTIRLPDIKEESPDVTFEFDGWTDPQQVQGAVPGVLDEDFNSTFRIPFEAIINPSFGVPRSQIEQYTGSTDNVELDLSGAKFFVSSSLYPYPVGARAKMPFAEWNHERDARYEMAANNFFGETVRFFLKDESLSAFTSLPENKWKVFEADKAYYMDIVLRKSEDLVMMESYQPPTSSVAGISIITGALGQKDTGRYFGWPFSISGAVDPSLSDMIAGGTEPAYAPFTPPYHEGESIARIKFTPTSTSTYTLQQIFSQAEVEYINKGLEGYEKTAAITGAMNVNSSVNLFGISREKEVIYDTTKGNSVKEVRDSQQSTNDRWIISTKMETPVLNFADRQKVPLTEVSHSWDTDAVILYDDKPELFDIGFGKGMWANYGDIPKEKEGIFLEIRESFPLETNRIIAPDTGSLLQQVGFISSRSKVGELAEKKIISEAIVVIPYLDTKKPNTTEIDCKHFIKIPKGVYDKQKQNIENGDAAIKVGDFSSETQIQETSISRMIQKMKKYVLPPQMNFMDFEDIEPFIMYFMEFEHTLDREDLRDIWCGVMPKIAENAEKEEVVFQHPAGRFEFFGEKGLPEDLRWMVFKVKKKAEKSYYAVTADTEDDSRFKFDFDIGRRTPEYSYNWPYDYCSLVELAKVDVGIEYTKDNTQDKIVKEVPSMAAEVLKKNVSEKK